MPGIGPDSFGVESALVEAEVAALAHVELEVAKITALPQLLV